MQKRFFFIRHAQSQANVGGISQPNAEINLSQIGQLQAQNLADKFDFIATKVYLSEFIRTYQTAKPYIDKHNIPYEKLALLNEFNTFGFETVQGLNGEQRRPLTLQYWQDKDPERRNGATGQTFNEFNQQVQQFIDYLPQLEHNSMIFGHGMFFSLFSWQLLGFYQPQVSSAQMGYFFNYHKGLPTPNTACYAIYYGTSPANSYIKYITNFEQLD